MSHSTRGAKESAQDSGKRFQLARGRTLSCITLEVTAKEPVCVQTENS
jgi:hypothetical protein